MQQKLSSENWLIKYKLYHIPFWFVYHFMWWTIAVGNPIKAAGILMTTPFFLKFLFYVIFQAFAVYFNLYYLIPKFLEKSKFTIYISLLLATIITSSICIVYGYYFTAFVNHTTVLQLFGSNACSFLFFSEALPSTMASTTLAMSIKLTKNWIQSQRRQQLLENEKLETELKFLKNQFNPHFLFNTINSIFFLIHKNPDEASASLAKFSELLRYQLYECNDLQIELSKELSYLKNYIELEKLRQSNYINISSKINDSNIEPFVIAPFVVMPFVENAFKHVSRNADKSDWIKIDVDVENQTINFEISNSFSDIKSGDVFEYGGIGLQNVKRRLELIYPNQYKLEIKNADNIFEVKLQIELSKIPAKQLKKYEMNESINAIV